MAIEIKPDRVIIIEHGDEGSKGGVETESKDDLPKETPINAVIGFGLIHGNENPVRVRLIAVETELLDEERDIARKLTRAESVLVQIHDLVDVTRQTGSDGAGKDTVQRAKDGNGAEIIQTVKSSGSLVDKRDERGVEFPKEAITSPAQKVWSLYVRRSFGPLDFILRGWAAHQSIKTPHIWSRRLNTG